MSAGVSSSSSIGPGRLGLTFREVGASLGDRRLMPTRVKSRDLIDGGLKPGSITSVSSELAAAHRRMRELQDEVKILWKAAAAVEQVELRSGHVTGVARIGVGRQAGARDRSSARARPGRDAVGCGVRWPARVPCPRWGSTIPLPVDPGRPGLDLGPDYTQGHSVPGPA
jgi:hypothetical protein